MMAEKTCKETPLWRLPERRHECLYSNSAYHSTAVSQVAQLLVESVQLPLAGIIMGMPSQKDASNSVLVINYKIDRNSGCKHLRNKFHKMATHFLSLS